MLVQGLGELVNCRRHFQPLIENIPLLLQLDVAGPFDEAVEVPFGLDVLSSAKILGSFLEKVVDHLLGLLILHHSGSQGHLLSLQHLERLAERERIFFFF